MTTSMVTIAGGTFENVASKVEEKHRGFCEFNDFDYTMHRDIISNGLPWSWSKLPAILDEFEKGYERVIWCDADCLPIADKFELPDLPIQVSIDYNGYCCGFMVLNREAIPFIEMWHMLGPLKHNDNKWEQSTFKHLSKFKSVSDMIFPIPETIVANPRTKGVDNPLFYHQWLGGDGSKWSA